MKWLVVVLMVFGSLNLSAGGFPVFDWSGAFLKGKALLKEIKQLRIMQKRARREIEAIKRMRQRLGRWQLSDLNSIDEMIRNINGFRARARSIGYTYDSISDQFDRVYGNKGTFKKNYNTWEKQSDDAVKDAMTSQGLLLDTNKKMADLDRVLKEKRNDDDQAATLQAIGEINAIQSKQLADLTQIVATDARAKHSVIMEQRAKEKAQRDYEAHLMKDFNVHKKSRPLAYFPSLGSTAPRVSR